MTSKRVNETHEEFLERRRIYQQEWRRKQGIKPKASAKKREVNNHRTGAYPKFLPRYLITRQLKKE